MKDCLFGDNCSMKWAVRVEIVWFRPAVARVLSRISFKKEWTEPPEDFNYGRFDAHVPLAFERDESRSQQRNRQAMVVVYEALKAYRRMSRANVQDVYVLFLYDFILKLQRPGAFSKLFCFLVCCVGLQDWPGNEMGSFIGLTAYQTFRLCLHRHEKYPASRAWAKTTV